MSIPFNKNNSQYARAKARLEEIKREFKYDPSVRHAPQTENPFVFNYRVCKLSDPFIDHLVVVHTVGDFRIPGCSCQYATKKMQMCPHIVAVIDYVEENPIPVVPSGVPVVFSCPRSAREIEQAIRPDPARRCGCGKTIKEGFRCKACQSEFEAQADFEEILKKDQADLFG